MPTNSEIYSVLTGLFADVFLRDDIRLTPALSASDVAGWDSMKQIEIIVCVEERFAIKLSTRELDSLQTVGDLVSVIERKLI